MQMRLAFSVATAVRPDILIVDEALSVGDSYFQHKSFDRIRKFRELGTTLLLVSHDKTAILSICDRVVLLNDGKIAMQGKPDVVLDYYNAIIAERGIDFVEQYDKENGAIVTKSGTSEARLTGISLLDELKRPVENVHVGQTVTLCLQIETTATLPELVVGYQIKDRFGQIIYGTNTAHHSCRLLDLEERESVEYHFTFRANLGVGSYSFSIALHADETHLFRNYEWRDLALVFNVINDEQAYFIGSSWLPPVIQCSRACSLRPD
jgi:lipopolysaccharide transport system ATP-binding protein